jgi:hypothetical protein
MAKAKRIALLLVAFLLLAATLYGSLMLLPPYIIVLAALGVLIAGTIAFKYSPTARFLFNTMFMYIRAFFIIGESCFHTETEAFRTVLC